MYQNEIRCNVILKEPLNLICILGPTCTVRKHNILSFTQFPTCFGVDLHHQQGNLNRKLRNY
jgi:hypothetical protein